MTDKEKAIVMAYTGTCMLVGDKFQIFHKYVEDIMGRPIMVHEMGLLADDIKGKAQADFIALCTDGSGLGVETENNAKDLAERICEQIAEEADYANVDRQWYFEKVIHYIRSESEE